MAGVGDDHINVTGSIDRKLMRTRKKPLRRQSTRKGKTGSPVPKRSGSLEDLYTGTLVTELPNDFPVLLDPNFLTDQVMDIDSILKQNGRNDTLKKNLEGKIQLSERAVKRLSIKRMKISTKSENEIGSIEATDSDNKTHSDAKTDSDTSAEVSMKSVPIVTLEPDIPCVSKNHVMASKIPNDVKLQPLNISRISSTSRDSSDSGIYDLNTREASTHGVSTENSPTETNVPDHILFPPKDLKTNLQILRTRTKNRPDSMLSQLCVVTVTLPANIYQGQKDRGAMLKFRFSPHAQIETLRVAILKVSNCIILYMYNAFTYM